MNANKQDAGGLPEPAAVVHNTDTPGHFAIITPAVGAGTTLYTADQMRAYGELCRAAPAGGDVAVGEIGELNGTKLIVGRDEDALARLPKGTKLYTRPQDSAPAGSVEVEEMAKRLLVEASDVVENTCLHDVLMRAAALLRKLQQPAEEDAYVIEQMGRLLAEIAIIVNGPEPALTKWSYHDLPEKVRKLQQGAECFVREMRTSKGSEFFVVVRCNGRELTPHMYAERWKAEYDVASWQHLLSGAPEPDILAYGPASQGQDGGKHG